MQEKTKLIFELSENPRPTNHLIARLDVPSIDFATYYGRDKWAEDLPDIPDLAEVQLVRHFTNMSTKNFGVDNGPYILGSCTMKYNPKLNEDMACLPGFSLVHPLQPESTVQGSLALLSKLEAALKDIFAMDAFSFQPSAGAHGELTGVMMIKAYHEARGDFDRRVMLIPDSAHGTNPASAAMASFSVREIKSNQHGRVDLADLKAQLADLKGQVAGIMLTNPNTLGLFEKDVLEITDLVHKAGGLCYYDGANANAILLQTRPGDMGFDLVHLNVHKTFSTPHGGGGPGAGPVGVKALLDPFLPRPLVKKSVTESGEAYYQLDNDRPQSIGKVRAFTGSFAILVRTYAYILSNGSRGLKEVAEAAVANANYLLERVRQAYDLPYPERPMHEFVISGQRQKDFNDIRTTDIVKRLIDYGYHPPTVYFPLIVHEAMMVEPTETETLEGLVGLAEAFCRIADEAKTDPDLLRSAPHFTPISRPDESKAARQPIIKA